MLPVLSIVRGVVGIAGGVMAGLGARHPRLALGFFAGVGVIALAYFLLL